MLRVSGDLNNGLLFSKVDKIKNIILATCFLLLAVVMLYPMFTLAEVQTDDGSGGYNYGNKILDVHRMIKYSEIYEEDAQLFSPEGDFNDYLKGVSESKPGLLARGLNDILIWVGDQLLSALDAFGLNLDKIIFGRIGAGDAVSWTTFAFNSNNPFGIAGIIIYNIVRAVCFLFIPQVLILAVLRLIFSKSPTAMSEAKDTIGIISLMGIVYLLFPYFYEIILYFRDVLIYISMGAAKQLLEVNTMSIIQNIRTLCDAENAGIVEGGVYLGFAIVTLYFGYIYIMIAMSHAIVLGSAPFVILQSRKAQNRDKVNEMVKEIFYLSVVPLIDAFIFLIPMIMMKFNAPGLIVLITVAGIAPLRSYARQRLGWTGSSGMMEMAGVGFLMGSLAVAKGAVNTGKRGIKSIAGHAGDAYNSNKKEKMYGEMADREGGASSNQEYNTVQNRNQNIDPFENMSTSDSQSGSLPNNTSYEKDYGRNSNTGGYGVAKNNQHQNIYDKYATNKSLEDPEFARNISNQKKAQLYKRKKRNHIAKAIASTAIIPAGMTGALVGASVGSGAGIYGVMQGAGIGGDMASETTQKVIDKIKVPSFSKGRRQAEGEASADVNVETTSEFKVDVYSEKRPDVKGNVDRVSGSVDMPNYNMEVHTPKVPDIDFYANNKENLAGDVFNTVTNKDFIKDNNKNALESKNEYLSKEINKNFGHRVSKIQGEISQDVKNQFLHDARREVMSDPKAIIKSREVYNQAKIDHGKKTIQERIDKKYGHAMKDNDWNRFNQDLESSIKNMSKKANTSYKPNSREGFSYE